MMVTDLYNTPVFVVMSKELEALASGQVNEMCKISYV